MDSKPSSSRYTYSLLDVFVLMTALCAAFAMIGVWGKNSAPYFISLCGAMLGISLGHRHWGSHDMVRQPRFYAGCSFFAMLGYTFGIAAVDGHGRELEFAAVYLLFAVTGLTAFVIVKWLRLRRRQENHSENSESSQDLR